MNSPPNSTPPGITAQGFDAERPVLIDVVSARVRHTKDLVDLVLMLLLVALTVFITVHAYSTTVAAANGIEAMVVPIQQQIVWIPVRLFEAIIIAVMPGIVLARILLSREWRHAGESVLAALLGVSIGYALIYLLLQWPLSPLATGLTTVDYFHAAYPVNPVLLAAAGFFTVAGRRSVDTVIRWSWNLLWLVLLLMTIRGAMTLFGALETLLIGRAVGLSLRYAFGVANTRTSGAELVLELRRAGLDPAWVVRIGPADKSLEMRAWRVNYELNHAGTAGSAETGPAPPSAKESPAEASLLPSYSLFSGQEAAASLQVEPEVNVPQVVEAMGSKALRSGHGHANRLYAVWDSQGRQRDVEVFDADRQLEGMLSDLLDYFRLRTMERTSTPTLRARAERAALMMMMMSVAQCGVRVAGCQQVVATDTAMLLVTEHIPPARVLDELADAELSDALLGQVWGQLIKAHGAGVAHKSLGINSVMVDTQGQPWLMDWQRGSVAAPEVVLRIDKAQLLVLTALYVGEERAIQAAQQALGSQELAMLAPLLQPIALPGSVRARLRGADNKKLLQRLRSRLVDLIPDAAQTPPVKLARFSVRTVIMAAVAVAALWVVLGSLDFEQVVAAIRGANLWWLLVAVGCAIATFVGAGLSLKSFTQQHLPAFNTILVQVAAAIVGLVTPAGVGPAALNLRYLNRNKVPTSVGVATVALVQISQLVTTLVLLTVFLIITGQSMNVSLPPLWVFALIGAVILVIAAIFMLASVRNWVWLRVQPTIEQVRPQLLWVFSTPTRLLAGMSANLLMSVAYIAAFDACLRAFGYHLDLITVAITYLISNSIGATVPSPGGLGPVEAALTGGLIAAGIPSGVAVSVAIVYRVITFWGRVPFSYVALQYLERRNLV